MSDTSIEVLSQNSSPFDERAENELRQAFRDRGIEILHESPLGEGTTGEVYRAASGRGSPIALKIPKNPRFNLVIERESRVLNALKPVRHALRCRDHFDVPSGLMEVIPPDDPDDAENGVEQSIPLHVMATDLLKGSNLHDSFLEEKGTLPTTPQVLSIARQALEFLAGAEEKEIIHADLKPENMIFEEEGGHLTVIDFGLSGKTGRIDPRQILQSRPYRSPESILKRGTTPSIDMWSLGCILFELYTGKKPLFDIHDPRDSLIEDSRHLWEMFQQLGNPSCDFLKGSPRYDALFFEDPNTGDISLRNGFDLHRIAKWKKEIYDAAYERGDSLDIPSGLIQLIEPMLRYENRITPSESLQNSLLLRNEVVVSVEFSPPPSPRRIAYTLSLFSESDYEENPEGSIKPLYSTPLHAGSSCLHIPKIDDGRYLIVLYRGDEKLNVSPVLWKGDSKIAIQANRGNFSIQLK